MLYKDGHPTPIVVWHYMADGSVLTDDELEQYKFDTDKVPFAVLQIVADMIKAKPLGTDKQTEGVVEI